MPTIFFYGPELDKEKKKELIASFTETASRLTGIDKSAFVVYLRPSSPDNVGVGGELLRERFQREGRQGSLKPANEPEP
jgi:4-oxalocrotonate tautomerase